MESVYAQRPSGEAAPHPHGRLAPINGLRGIAIVGVLYFHVIGGLWSAAQLPAWLAPFVTNTWTGVNLFFILSGFVLFLPYAADGKAMRPVSERLRFYRRRAWRLLPLFYVAVAVQWSVAALCGTSGLDELVRVASFQLIVSPQDFFPSFNGPLWSIGAEIAFSVLFPMLVLASLKLGIGRVMAVVLALALGMRLVGYMHAPSPEVVGFNTDMFLCRIDEFVLGMLLARLYVERRLPGAAGPCLLAGAVLIVLTWIGFDLTARHVLPSLLRAGLNDVLDAGFCLVIAAALVPDSRVGAALSWRPLQVLGMMCYSLYIWHWPLLHWIMPDRAVMPAGAFAAGVVAFLLATLAVAALSYRFIEFGRVRQWRKLFLLGPAPRPAMVIGGAVRGGDVGA
jgi:peptidoglycan/LPS O-acetylase OafA/YrhL